MKLEIVTPTGKVLDVEAQSITAPGAGGEFGVLPGHRPALVMLGGGTISYESAEGAGRVHLRGGVAELRADAVLVLADEVTRPEDVDRERAETLLQSALDGVAQAGCLDDDRLLRLGADRAYAEAMLKTAGH